MYQMVPQGWKRWFEPIEKQRESWVNRRARFAVMLCFWGDLTPKRRWEQCQARLTHLPAQKTQGLFADRYQQAVRLVREELAWAPALLQLTQKQAVGQG